MAEGETATTATKGTKGRRQAVATFRIPGHVNDRTCVYLNTTCTCNPFSLGEYGRKEAGGATHTSPPSYGSFATMRATAAASASTHRSVKSTRAHTAKREREGRNRAPRQVRAVRCWRPLAMQPILSHPNQSLHNKPRGVPHSSEENLQSQEPFVRLPALARAPSCRCAPV